MWIPGRTLKRSALPALLLLLAPRAAGADVGTPLVWATSFHLLLGNFFLGCLEGALLSKLYRLPLSRCALAMVLANYASAWCGLFLVAGLGQWLHPDLNTVGVVFALLVFATYLLTLVLEWPAVAYCFRDSPRWLSRSLKASVVVQTTSYLLLFGGFWLVSGSSLLTGFTVVPADELRLPSDVQVFFIRDGGVHRRSAHHEEVLPVELRPRAVEAAGAVGG